MREARGGGEHPELAVHGEGRTRKGAGLTLEALHQARRHRGVDLTCHDERQKRRKESPAATRGCGSPSPHPWAGRSLVRHGGDVNVPDVRSRHEKILQIRTRAPAPEPTQSSIPGPSRMLLSLPAPPRYSCSLRSPFP